MSYFDFFCKNINKAVIQEADFIKGTCNVMCPQDEVTMREKEKLVHKLEVIGTRKRLVKCYSRSAADSNMAIPRLLRPYPILRETVHYLLLNVTKRTDVPASVVYDFVNDRLRAVRQDMTIQRLPPEECIILLEPMIRFYVYYGYRLCECPLNDYDPVLNKKYLLECLNWFLNCCDIIDETLKNGGKIDEITGFMADLGIDNKYEKKLTCDRILMECLYILCNLDDLHPLYRCLNLRKDIKRAVNLQLTYNIAVANLRGNYVQVCKQSAGLCPLTYCALCTYLPVLQRQALLVMSHAYSSKMWTVPLCELRRWLRFDSDADAELACKHYGLAVESGAVKFFKSDLRTDAVLLPPKRQPVNDGNMDLSIENVFTYSVHT